MPTEPKAKRGRPRKPARQRRVNQIIVRVTDAEREEIKQAAREASRPVSDFLVVRAIGRRITLVGG